MNKETRKRLESLKEQLDGIVSELNEIADAEEEKYENAPENLQTSERVGAWQECADQIRSICDDIENASDELESEVIDVY